jgi:hypothetical protein
MGRTDLAIGISMNVQNLNNPFANGYGAALGGAAGFGGAIFTRAGTLNLIGDTFSSNSAVGGLPERRAKADHSSSMTPPATTWMQPPPSPAASQPPPA